MEYFQTYLQFTQTALPFTDKKKYTEFYLGMTFRLFSKIERNIDF